MTARKTTLQPYAFVIEKRAAVDLLPWLLHPDQDASRTAQEIQRSATALHKDGVIEVAHGYIFQTQRGRDLLAAPEAEAFRQMASSPIEEQAYVRGMKIGKTAVSSSRGGLNHSGRLLAVVYQLGDATLWYDALLPFAPKPHCVSHSIRQAVAA